MWGLNTKRRSPAALGLLALALLLWAGRASAAPTATASPTPQCGGFTVSVGGSPYSGPPTPSNTWVGINSLATQGTFSYVLYVDGVVASSIPPASSNSYDAILNLAPGCHTLFATMVEDWSGNLYYGCATSTYCVPVASATPSVTPSRTPTAGLTSTLTFSATPSATPTATPSASPSATPTASATATATATPAPSATLTQTPNGSVTPLPSGTLPPPPGGAGSYPYPNPAKGTVNFEVTAPGPGTATITVLNGGGSPVTQLTQSVQGGTNSVAMNLGGYAAGVYYYQVVLALADGTAQTLAVQNFIVLP